jgi:voltage-gated potassium channel
MINSISGKLKSLPFVKIDNKEVEKKLQNRPYTKIIVDILDGDLWSSKVSFWGNSILILLISLSSLEVIFSSDTSLSAYFNFLNIIYFSTSILFLFEIICRLSFANLVNPKYQGIKGVFMYLFSFYGLVDFLSIIPFCTALIGINTFHFLSIIRIFRVWRIVRYIPAFSSITSAFRSKRDEILVSLLGVLLLSITISAFIFYAEIGNGSNDFKSIMDVFVWSLGKYTGDYGSIAEATPVTIIGKFLATLNGFLGLALFAVPAGLLGSAFIDELTDKKQKKFVDARISEINHFFDSGYKSRFLLNKRKSHFRYLSFDALQARLIYSDNEILECVRDSCNLRFRPMKSNDDLKFSDIKIIEKYIKNTSYGCNLINPKSNVYIINPLGAIERCISHFSHAIVDILGYNYISREIRLVDIENEAIGGNKTKYYSDFDLNDTSQIPAAFVDFMSDLDKIKKNDTVILLSSGASNRGQYIFEYGNYKGIEEVIEGVSTIDNISIVNSIKNELKNCLKESTSSINFDSYAIENHTIGNHDEDWLGKVIRNKSGANVITIYINIDILTGEDKLYFSNLNIILNTFEESLGNHKHI